MNTNKHFNTKFGPKLNKYMDGHKGLSTVLIEYKDKLNDKKFLLDFSNNTNISLQRIEHTIKKLKETNQI